MPKEAFAWFIEELDEGVVMMRSHSGNYLAASAVSPGHHHPHLEALSAGLGLSLTGDAAKKQSSSPFTLITDPKEFVWEKVAHNSAIIGQTITLKVPGEERWVYVNPGATGGEENVVLSSAFETRFILEAYNPYWGQHSGELYADLENLHGNWLVGQLREQVFAVKFSKLKDQLSGL